MAVVSKTNPVYFIYTTNKLNGGIELPPTGVDIGLSSYENIYSGMATNSLLLLNISEYNPIIVSKDAALGLSLVGATTILEDAANNVTRALNKDELLQQTAATKLIRKLKIRFEIKSAIGDDGDLISDLSKRVALVERMVMHYMDSVLNANPLPTATLAEYKAVIASYTAGVASGALVDTIDLSPTADTIAKLTTRYTEIANIITNTK